MKEGHTEVTNKFFAKEMKKPTPGHSLRGFAWQWLMDKNYRGKGKSAG